MLRFRIKLVHTYSVTPIFPSDASISSRVSPNYPPRAGSAVSRRPSRRQLLRGLGAGIVGLGAGTVAYSAGFEPFHPVVERVDIPIVGLPRAFEGFRIAQLSDLHVQPGFGADALVPALKLAQAETPDLFAITGDYINDDAPDPDDHMHACARALAGLKAPSGVFATFGNHDYPPPPADPSPLPWAAAGIRTLSDEVVPIHRGSDSIYLVGLRSFTKRPVAPAEILRLAPPRATKIVLWHEPDRAEECALGGAALQLSGHTHGGQVVLPWIGPPLLPAGGRKYPSGLFTVAGMPLYVTRGVGLLNPRLRLNCPPEVTLLTLRRAT
jgi:predicted MPP superfamily phosphohydrolase